MWHGGDRARGQIVGDLLCDLGQSTSLCASVPSPVSGDGQLCEIMAAESLVPQRTAPVCNTPDRWIHL